MLLRPMGHDVRVARDGPPAFAEADRHRPRLVLLDIGLPGMDGYEVARRLRRHEAMAGAVVVAMTRYGPAGRPTTIRVGRLRRAHD